MLILSFGTTRAIIAALAMALFVIGPAAEADTCVAIGSSFEWTTTSAWSCGSQGHYPGQTGADTAIMSGTFGVAVANSIPNPVTINSGGMQMSVQPGGSLTLDPSSSISSGNVTISGGALTINGGGTFAPSMMLSLINGGQLNLASGATFAANLSSVTLSDGTISGPAGSSIDMGSSGYMISTDGSTGLTITGGVQLKSSGTANFIGGLPLSINNGSRIVIGSGGTFSYNTSAPIQSSGGGSIDVGSGGMLRYTLGSGTGVISAAVNNSGTVSAQYAALQLNGGGTSAGSYSASGSGSPSITFSSSHTFNSGTTFATPMSRPGYVFTGTAATTYAFNAPVTIPQLEWSGGTIDGNGTAAVTVTGGLFDAASSSLTVAPNGRVAIDSGYTDYSPSGSNLLTINGKVTVSTALPLATFSLYADVLGSGSIVVTDGGELDTFNKIAIAPRLDVLGSSPTAATVWPYSGSIVTLQGGGSLNAGTFDLSGRLLPSLAKRIPLSVGPPPILVLASGTFTAADSSMFTGAGTIKVAGGSLSFLAATGTFSPSLEVDSGSVAVASGATLTLSSPLVWNGGLLQGSGGLATIFAGFGGGNPSPAGALALDKMHLTNAATFAFTPTFAMTLANGSIFDNPGTLTLGGDGTIGGDASSSVQSNGAIVKTAGSGASSFGVPVIIGGSGSVAFSGTPAGLGTSIQFNAGGVSSGSMNAGANTILFGSATFNIIGGIVQDTGGGYAVVGPTVVNQTPAATVSNLSIGSGSTWTVLSPGSLGVGISLIMNGGTIGGTGSLSTFASTAISAPSGTSAIGVPATLGGATLNVGSLATLVINSGGSSSGAMTIASNANLWLAGGFNVNSGGSIANAGAVVVNSAAFNSGSSYTGAGSVKVSGPLTLASPISIATFIMTGGSISGAPVTVTGSGQWGGGSIANGLTNGGTFTCDGALGAMAFSGTLTNNGTFVAGPLTNPLTFSSATINNASTSSLFDIKADTTFGSGPTPFTNSGILKKSAGTGTTTTNFAVTTTGTVQVLSGTLQFNTLTQNGSTALLNNGGGLVVSPGPITLNGGVLNGNGTISGSVVNNGASVNPGNSPGTITITGNYTQGTSGILNLEIQGTSAGQFDVLNVGGTATLGGTLNVIQLSPYVPAGGNTFTMMTYASKSGAFNSVVLPAGGYSATANPTALVVTVTQADVAVTQSGPASVLHGQNATFNVTVTNNGASTASAVTFSDTFSSGTFVSATPSQGICSFSTSISCSLGALAPGNSATIQVTITGSTIGSITNQPSASSIEYDPNSGNDAATPLTVSVTAASDLKTTVGTTPALVPPGGSFTVPFRVDNLGPDATTSYTISFVPTGASISSISAPGLSCTNSGSSATCSGTSLASGSFVTATVTLIATGNPIGITGTASTTGDPVSSNNSATASVSVKAASADLSVTKSGPASAAFGDTVSYTVAVTNNGQANAPNVVLSDSTPAGLTLVSVTGACTSFPCTLASMAPGASATVTAKYTVNVGAPSSVINTASVYADIYDPDTTNNTASAQTAISGCGATPPVLRSPLGTTVVKSPVTFVWDASVPAATQYEVFVVQNNTPTSVGKTTATSLSGITVPTGQVTWYVVATIPTCGTVQSTVANGNACNVPLPPTPNVVANAASGQTYNVSWDSVADATSYDIQESTDLSFSNPTQRSVSTTSAAFSHTATSSAQPYYYVVRGVGPCGTGSFSQSVRVVVAPPGSGANVPAGSTTTVVQTVFIPGRPDGSYAFTATVDKPWMSVNPSSGTLTPAGITLSVSTDPSNLTNGTFTGTVIVTLTPLTVSAGAHTQGTTTVSVPVSVSLVTPVSPTTKTSTAANALIIPSVGHLGGINSQWQSDIRLANVGFSRQQYALSFIPSGATGAGVTSGVKTTNMTVDAGTTAALDDVVRNWYGVGSLGETSNGVLEIKPLSAGQDGPGTTITTVVSSRTYNASSQGTLGQYIPAIPFASFVGKADANGLATILSLQQVQQSSAYRTNIGVVEGAGSAANVTLSVYDGVGKKLTDFAMSLAPYQQVQLNSFLASQNIALNDGRVEVKVTDGGGKVTAYASVIDNATNDPFLVSAVPVGGSQSDRYVLPGVAALNTGTANWQTDMRIFNSGAAPQNATLTLYPLGGGTPLTATTQVNPGEVKTLNSVVQSLFNQDNLGGALHVVTSTLSNLVVTGRTYNQTATGTYGQFVPAVTASDAASLGGRSLNLLQVEDSPRYRTNLGIAEVSGKPATVQIMVVLPDSKVTPKIEIPLAAYQYMQIPIIQSMGLGNVYNARINIQVTGGDGKVASYASVIDQNTQDPTYVPAQ